MSLQPLEAKMSWLGRYVNVHRRSALLALGTGFIGGATAALEPYLIGVIIDHVRTGYTPEQLLPDIVLLLALALISAIAFHGQRRFSGEVAYNVVYDIRHDLFDNMLTFDQSFYQRYATGDLISRMHSDIEAIWRLLAIGFTRFGSAFFTVIIAFILLATVDLRLTAVVFVVLTISTIFQLRAGLILAPVFEKVQEQAGTLSALVQDSVSGVQTIKTFGKEEGAARKFAEENNEYRRRWLYFKRRNEPVGMLPNMISETTTGIVVLFGGILAVQGQLTLGNFTQFLIYLALIANVLLQLGAIYQRYQQTRGALVRFTPLLGVPNVRNKPDAKPLLTPRGDIQLENVGIKADDEWILRDINLTIPAGQVTALVGPTGCGKTQLVNLLSRVYDPTEGRVLIDGVDVRDLDLDSLRRAIAYVPQSTFLFSQTLAENVRMGREDFGDEALSQAVHISRVSNDLPQLPHGMETLVGEKGVMLSGGQKQRVAIARAIIRDPAILVLDDALSSVDTHTAADILNDLRQVLHTRTSIIIAHRIATVKDADHIVVMDEGRIIEQGNHEHLIAHGGLYARMVERELRGDDGYYETAAD